MPEEKKTPLFNQHVSSTQGSCVQDASSLSAHGMFHETPYRPSFTLFQCCLLQLYLILLPFFIQIHWGMGRFCFCFLARNLILKVLWEGMASNGHVCTAMMVEKRRGNHRVSLALWVPLPLSSQTSFLLSLPFCSLLQRPCFNHV